MFSWVPQNAQSSTAKHEINCRISECPHLNVIFHCRSSMKTMKGCDFCSKFISGRAVVCCSSTFGTWSTAAPAWSHRWAYCNLTLLKTTEINAWQQQERKGKHSMTIHGFCGKTLSLEGATAEPGTGLCSGA